MFTVLCSCLLLILLLYNFRLTIYIIYVCIKFIEFQKGVKYKNLIIKILTWTAISLAGILLLAVSTVYLFKDKIIKASVTEINKYLNAKVDINENIELSLFDKFPQVAIGFKDVKIHESIPGSKKLLGKADELYLTFNFWNILDGKYIINKLYLENGNFALRVYKDGVNNYSILKKDSTKSGNSSGGLDLTDIYLKNVLVSYANEINDQFYEVLSHELKAGFTLKDEVYLIAVNGPQLINTIQIHDGEYFKGKEIFISSNLKYDNTEKKFTILPTSIKLEQSEFKVEGYYAFKDQNIIDIKVDNDNGDIQTLLSLIPKKYYERFSSYKSEGDIYFHASVKGLVSETENAAIKVDFGCKKTSFFHPDFKKKITDANFSGVFSNGDQKNAASSYLKLENIRFDFDDKMIQGNFLYRNFNNPYIAFDATGVVDASSILGFYKIPNLKSASGNIDFDINFKGLLNDFKTREGHNRIETSGEITIKNLTCVPENANFKLEEANGTFIFNKNDIAISDLSIKAGKSDFRISGMLKNLFGALLLENGHMLTDIQVQSRKIDVEELFSFKRNEEENVEGSSEKEGVFPYMEKYLSKVDIDVKEIVYKKVKMSHFKGALSFDQPYMKADNLSFHIAGGELSLNSQLNFESENKIITTIRSTLKTINIDSLLYMFDNFGQDFITYKNLRGEFSGSVETAFNWNKKGEINMQSLVASIDGSILKGELNDFEPMQNLARFIDAQELAHIKFSEIKNKVFIENRKISLPEMQILSNVSDISISGTHTFDNEIDYKLTVPLRNIKKPKIDKDAAFGAIEEDTKKGSTLFLTIKGTANNYKIGYDTKRTKSKISDDLKKEKKEFLDIFKKKEEEIKPSVKPDENVFFNF